jgi:hypothetical protein
VEEDRRSTRPLRIKLEQQARAIVAMLNKGSNQIELERIEIRAHAFE